MKTKCRGCLERQAQLDTLALTLAASQGRIDECRRLKHQPYKPMGKSDLCVNCLRQGFATVAILAGMISKPMEERDMNHKHVGPPDVACRGCLQEAQEDIVSDQRNRTVAGILLLVGLLIGGLLLLSWYLTDHGPHLR